MKKDEATAALLARNEIDALFVTSGPNIKYIEGFSGSDSFLLISGDGNYLITDSRYTEMAERECRGAAVLPHRPPYPRLGEVISKLAREKGFARIGFEADNITYRQHETLAGAAESAAVELVATSSLIESLRAVKTPEEAALIGAACQIADRALSDLVPLIKPGASELDLRTELDYLMKRGGAEDVSFETMVLFGARSSQPHAVSRADVRLHAGDFILIDYGAVKSGYRSDTTRTFVCGRASDEQRFAYERVLESQLAALELVAPGADGREINRVALDIITAAGLPAFGYSISHGVGLEIHELPTLRQGSDVRLEPGMVLTVEPGTYKPGWGGIRIEDTVVVTESGHCRLTFFTKELLEL